MKRKLMMLVGVVALVLLGAPLSWWLRGAPPEERALKQHLSVHGIHLESPQAQVRDLLGQPDPSLSMENILDYYRFPDGGSVEVYYKEGRVDSLVADSLEVDAVRVVGPEEIRQALGQKLAEEYVFQDCSVAIPSRGHGLVRLKKR